MRRRGDFTNVTGCSTSFHLNPIKKWTFTFPKVVWDVDPRTTEEREAALLDATEEEDDDWGALDRTMMEELAKGWEETSTEAVRRFQGDAEEDDQSQSLLDDMEDMFA